MKKRATKAIALLLTFCITFSGLPLIFGSLDVNAASTTKKKITLKAAVTEKTNVKLKWNKVKSPGKGYAVFRDGKVIKRLSTKKTSFTDKGLEPGSTYKYQIKTYTKKKVTKWYNKKTKKWQKKKPAKKYRGRSKKVKVYAYKKESNTVKVKVNTSNYDTKPSDSDESDTDTDKASTDDTDTGDAEKPITDDAVNEGTDKTSADDTLNKDTSKPATEDTGNSGNEKPASDNTGNGGNEKPVTNDTGNDGTDKTSTDDTVQSKYTYDIKFINEPYGNGGKSVIYIETNNPDPLSMVANATNASGKNVTANVIGIPSDYADVQFTDEDEFYVGNGIPVILGPTEAGQLTFNVEEVDRATNVRIIVASRTVTVKDYKAEEIAWRQRVIQNVCTESMTNKEKMQAICGYILTNFKYLPTYRGQYVLIFKNEGIPYWVRKEIDSSGSPAALVDFGNDLGYPLEDLFNKYERGTPEWKQYHMCAYSAADDYYYKACPPSDTNIVNPSDITFNPDTYQFWGE